MVTRLYYWLVYRRLMTVMHRFGWHHMRHHAPFPPHTDMPDGFLKCDWCGIHSDIPHSMRAKKVEAMIARSALEAKP
jgi:hypothetical protein